MSEPKKELRDAGAKAGAEVGRVLLSAFVDWLKTRPAVWQARREARRERRSKR